MSHTQGKAIDTEQATAFLTTIIDPACSDIVLLGEGAWSRCFGFRRGGAEFAIRFGQYLEDFEKDHLAYRYHSPALPIPQVQAIGEAFGGYYAISARVHGAPLEHMNAVQWHKAIPTVVDALEAMRLADISAMSGYGGWNATGQAPFSQWADYLLAVGADSPSDRSQGWRAKLATLPQGEAAFVWGMEKLKQVAHTPAPRCLLHCDLINRNVLAAEDRINGIFDWGCGCYGDHLYDLAWFEFWAPWSPELDIVALRSALEQRWHTIGYVPHQQNERLMACYLHIGIGHLGYNAHLGRWETLLATAERMRALVAAAEQAR